MLAQEVQLVGGSGDARPVDARRQDDPVGGEHRGALFAGLRGEGRLCGLVQKLGVASRLVRATSRPRWTRRPRRPPSPAQPVAPAAGGQVRAGLPVAARLGPSGARGALRPCRHPSACRGRHGPNKSRAQAPLATGSRSSWGWTGPSTERSSSSSSSSKGSARLAHAG